MTAVGLVGRESECAVLDEFVESVRAGHSRALVIRGEPGIGKTSLLRRLVESAADVQMLEVVGVESEMELAFAGLQRLCSRLLDRLESLPDPQRDALTTAFGLQSGTPPERFLVGLAVLGLLSDAAERRPIVCIVDDAQWLDRSSVQALTFAARRLQVDSVGMVFSTREPNAELAALPELVVMGLRDADARLVLGSLPDVPFDRQVRDRVVREAYGNPLALLEWRRAATAAELGGASRNDRTSSLTGRIEDVFRQKVSELPSATQRLLVVAAAESVGDPVIVWQAAQKLQIEANDYGPAIAAGLVEVDSSVRFPHPLARSAAYQSASAVAQRQAHRALADSIDPEIDPDRRAWHMARAAVGPDDDVASELEQSAERAQARGGLAATAAFLERSAELSADPLRRATRAISAAHAKHQAGEADAALGLLAMAMAGPLDDFALARAEMLHAQIAHSQNRRSDAPDLMLRAAKRLENLDLALARDTYLYAVWAAQFAGRLARGGQLLEVARTALAAPRLPQPRASDALLEGCATSLLSGYAAGAPMLKSAVQSFCREDISREDSLRWWTFAAVVAQFLWDYESAETLSARHVQLARDTGAVTMLAVAQGMRSVVLTLGGDLLGATQLLHETQTLTEAIGMKRQPYAALMVAAWRGHETEVSTLANATLADAVAHGEDEAVAAAQYALAVMCNGLGRYQEALVAALASVPPAADGQTISNFALVELVEAAARSGQVEQAHKALDALTEITRASGTDWALGVEARSRALVSGNDVAESLYEEAIERLGRARIAGQLARAHLVYGEWLRRENRRVDARAQLRTAYEMSASMGVEAFAERARRELAATGETVRVRSVETFAELTAQEAQIARLASAGRTNPEIGAELFISARTVEWHLRKVFTRLSITSRKQLRGALPQRL